MFRGRLSTASKYKRQKFCEGRTLARIAWGFALLVATVAVLLVAWLALRPQEVSRGEIVPAAVLAAPVSPQRAIQKPVLSVEEIIRSVAVNDNLLVAIAKCESSLNPAAVGKVNPGDRGLFQINREYHPDVADSCAFDAECSARWADAQVSAGRLWLWNPSRSCWE